ncbi:3-phosphoserine/phosphohydroxythreonine transaminase [Pedobacter gandavensis]|uniref:Phosphoserine aminotransferase n=1 Tax=Pedobacter gandavensis TaxID=2679963 RepID=A0ABR6F107_9SPHI|nr:3-phosphoserine/phosphohydroxythreonine transaminase [Pedobacter gandavensis]MBB2150916.1 3-phosphoserine/phosphohydroxythreonine transaminase [Pedobacter gandavensis]
MKHNFGAGPCILPAIVLDQAADAVRDFNGIGLSILEISHRTPEFEAVINETQGLVRELLNVPADYSILFLQGGASTQFSMLAMNFLHQGKKAAYLDTGFFSLKAIKEALFFGEVDIVASSKDKNYYYVPVGYQIPATAAYFHYCSNNTIEGTEMFSHPASSVPVICDMSSDIFSRPIQVADFDLIYAGAQKNMGPAGMTLVVVKNNLLEKITAEVASMSDYRIFRDNNSMFNTPPVFSIYVAMLNLRWLKEKGGVTQQEVENIAKSDLLYTEIDRNTLFYGLADPKDRSRMNVTFKMHDPGLEAEFLDFASQKGIVGIKGYPSAGGFRVSLYNALPISSVEVLVKCMQDFEAKNLNQKVSLENKVTV